MAGRIVVGGVGDESDALGVARALRDVGHEVVFVGGGQSPEQLIRAAVAEDAEELVVEGVADQALLSALRDELGAEHIRLTAADPCDRPDTPAPPSSG